MSATITYRSDGPLPLDQLESLYVENTWSSGQRPEQLQKALANSHSLITAWDEQQLVGLGNAISDGHLVVYFPHLVVRPSYQRQGIGREILTRLLARYDGFHQQVLIADHRAIAFYRACGFERAGKTVPMWIYAGDDH